jgi:biotin transport system substrate-specific component
MAIAPGTTIMDYIVPNRASRSMNLLKDAALIIGSSILMCLAANAKIRLPYTPIDLTLQTFVLLLVSAVLGSKRGALAMILYLIEGESGLPVFSQGGGLAYLFVAPSAGYLWSYPFAAFVVGWFSERGLDRNLVTAFIAMLLGSAIIYIGGVSWLFLFVVQHNLNLALQFGLYPFVVGDLIKIACATALLPAAWLLVRKIKPEEDIR